MLGGAFTGDLPVDPTRVRDLLHARQHETGIATEADEATTRAGNETIAERRRRTRDAVAAALSDIILPVSRSRCGWPCMRRFAQTASTALDSRPMKRLLLTLATLCLVAQTWAAQPVLSPAELTVLGAATPPPRVIDIRPLQDYAAGHIPGALSAPYAQWRGPASNPGALPPLTQFTETVRALGLTPATHAVVVSSGADFTDFGASARVYWTLKMLGMSELSLLNGGMVAWRADGRPLSTQAASVARSTWQPQMNEALIATRDEIAASLPGRQMALIDARPASFFAGETAHGAAMVAGTLPGAVNVDSAQWFESGSARLRPVREIAALDARRPLPQAESAVAFCNTGHWAATDWFIYSEVLQRPGVSLYPGSMVDWTQATRALPMDNEPGRAQQIWTKLQIWWQNLSGGKQG